MTPSLPAYRIGVISDTHGKLAGSVLKIFAGVDLILHAGDVGNDDVLFALEAVAPLAAVSGNVDGPSDPRLRPYLRSLDTPAGKIVLTHGHLPIAPSANRAKMVAHFRDDHPDIIVYGHSHIPNLEQIGGIYLFNPGSASLNRWGKGNTVGMITLPSPGAELKFEHIVIE